MIIQRRSEMLTEELLNEIEECICLISNSEILSNKRLKDSIDLLAKSLSKAESKLKEDHYMLQYLDGGLLLGH